MFWLLFRSKLHRKRAEVK